MTKLISTLLSVLFVIGSLGHNLAYFFTPAIEFDSAAYEGDFTHGACGFLYGMAQENVPSKEVVKSLRISSSSQKVIGGLQHPIGDIDNVYMNLADSDYSVVYLQDSYPDWYYAHSEINRRREAGEYDCSEFVKTDFLPKVREKVEALSAKPYSDNLVYCLYNECDNTVWFGSEHPDGYLMFDEAAKQRFYSAWKETFELVRSIDGDALIGGPGYCDYDIYEITDFLSYCKENDCLPDVMIYHELSPSSSMWWTDHVKEYRQKEKELGIDPLAIIVTEYGTMEECGMPCDMIHYITAIESSGTYGNIAYWRLADNFCDTCAYANIPNSQWWLYKWYSDMSGRRLKTEVADIMHSDVANVIKYARDSYHLSELDGIACFSEESKRTDIICCGMDYDYLVALKNIRKTMGKNVKVKIAAVTYEGLSGEVLSPCVINEYETKVTGKLKIDMKGTDKYAVYHITVTPADGKTDALSPLPDRFEFESGTLLGSAYTYDSAYATTGDIKGMCGGFENDGDGISLEFEVPESGDYELSLVYGKCNDGPSPGSRRDAKALMTVDSEEETVSLRNTIKSEYTDKYTFTKHLEAGNHSIKMMHKDGTFTLDSLLIRKAVKKEIYCEFSERYKEHLVIAPADGYYSFGSGSERYLKRGLNYAKLNTGKDIIVSITGRNDYAVISPDECTLTPGAVIQSTGGRECITGINSESGSAEFAVNAPQDSKYAITVTYSNNEEDGAHAYNVDIVEEYITISANGEALELWCTNTYSDYSFGTAVGYINLKQGENIITLSNDGHNRFIGKTANSPNIALIKINPETVISG